MRKVVGLTLILVLALAVSGAFAQKRYVGENNCKMCHSARWGEYKHSAHWQMILVPTDTGATPQYGGHSIFDSRTPGYDSLVVRYWPSNPATAWKYIMAREYFYKDTIATNIWSRLPVYWDSVMGSWRRGDTLWVDSTKSLQRTCGFGCHYTGDTLVNAFRGNANQLGIKCEMCHGPGSLHFGDTTQIVSDRSSIVCGQCHTSGWARNGASSGLHGYPYDEAGWRPYDVTHRDSLLSVYWRMRPSINPGETSSTWWPDGYSPKYYNTRQFPEWYYHSRHRTAGVECVDCHDPHKETGHPAQLVRDPDDNSLCANTAANCHANKVPSDSLIAHTHHANDPVNTGRSRCIKCHMGSAFSASSTMQNHTFRPSKPASTMNAVWRTPPLTGNPNTCAFECHNVTTFYPHRSDTALRVWNMPIDVEIAESLDIYWRQWWPVGVEAGGSEGMELDFAVFQNAPNPFVTATRIDFALPAQTPVEVKIYNSLGQVVRTLVNETRKAGRYSEVWDGRNDRQVKVPAGVYFYKVSAGTQTGLKKLVLIR